ncbi:hypothetical protein H4S06_000681 [Coemansia sp. BCRC 34490]|nr:hypothetical protein H4S06_000681 [Coemansia sp. BCRC 34490]
MISSQIQMLALATETRQYTTLRLPTSQWGLPVVTITALTLLGRTAQTLLTFSLQDKVISVAPLLSMQRIGKRRVSTYVQMWAQEENSVLKLAANPATVTQAIKMYKGNFLKIPLSSNTPWILLSEICRTQDTVDPHFEWLVQSIRTMYKGKDQSIGELLLRAYIYTGDQDTLRDSVWELCRNPKALSALTVSEIFLELWSSREDRKLACTLWASMSQHPDFIPSQSCVKLALKLAIISRDIDLARYTYNLIVSGKWASIEPGFWADSLIIHGLANEGLDTEASYVTMATDDRRMSENQVVAMLTIRKYELLLKALSRRQRVDLAEAMFAYIRNNLGLYPTPSIYGSLLGVVARHRKWDVIDGYLHMMEEDGICASHKVWGRILLGGAQQADVDICDKVLDIMTKLCIPFSYTVVTAALELFLRMEDFEMVLRWYNVVYQVLCMQARIPLSKRGNVALDAVKWPNNVRSSTINTKATDKMRLTSKPPGPYSMAQPEYFIAHFVHEKALIWHRKVLGLTLEIIGHIGDIKLLMRVWDDILMFRRKVRTLKLSPYIFMVLTRSLAQLGVLKQYKSYLIMWINDRNNHFTASQTESIIQVVNNYMLKPNGATFRSIVHLPRAHQRDHLARYFREFAEHSNVDSLQNNPLKGHLDEFFREYVENTGIYSHEDAAKIDGDANEELYGKPASNSNNNNTDYDGAFVKIDSVDQTRL